MKYCIYKLYYGFCCLLNSCKCVNKDRDKTIENLNPFMYTGM